MQIDLSQIYLLIFKSQIDSNSYSPQFHFMNIITICKYLNLTNIIPIHKYLLKVFMNISFLYWIYIKSMHISHYGFVWSINYSNEKNIGVQNKNFLDLFWEKKKDIRYSWIIREYFPSDEYYSYSYLQVLEFTNYSYSYSYRSWLRKTIPIPIRGKNYYLLITAGAVKKVTFLQKVDRISFEWKSMFFFAFSHFNYFFGSHGHIPAIFKF